MPKEIGTVDALPEPEKSRALLEQKKEAERKKDPASMGLEQRVSRLEIILGVDKPRA